MSFFSLPSAFNDNIAYIAALGGEYVKFAGDNSNTVVSVIA